MLQYFLKIWGKWEDARCHESWEALFLLEATFSTVDARSPNSWKSSATAFLQRTKYLKHPTPSRTPSNSTSKSTRCAGDTCHPEVLWIDGVPLAQTKAILRHGRFPWAGLRSNSGLGRSDLGWLVGLETRDKMRVFLFQRSLKQGDLRLQLIRFNRRQCRVANLPGHCKA